MTFCMILFVVFSEELMDYGTLPAESDECLKCLLIHSAVFNSCRRAHTLMKRWDEMRKVTKNHTWCVIAKFVCMESSVACLTWSLLWSLPNCTIAQTVLAQLQNVGACTQEVGILLHNAKDFHGTREGWGNDTKSAIFHHYCLESWFTDTLIHRRLDPQWTTQIVRVLDKYFLVFLSPATGCSFLARITSTDFSHVRPASNPVWPATRVKSRWLAQ